MTESPEAISRKDLIEILRVGLQAVSPYNAQPWGFQFKDNQLLIYTRHNDRGFWKCKDAIFHSLGAFLENLSEGARHYHYEISFTHETDKYMNLTKPLCFVNFKKSTDSCNYPIDHIMSRYTNRKTYSTKAVSPSVIENMRAIFNGPNKRILDLTGQRLFIENCAVLEKIRNTNRQIGEELTEILSFTDAEAQKRRWGLDIRTLELPPHVRQYLRLTRNKLFRSLTRGSFIVTSLGVKYFEKSLLGTPLLLAFQDADPTPGNMVQDWMNIQKILNILHREGLSAHLIAASIDMVKLDHAFLSPQEIKTIARVNANIEQKTGIKLKSLLTLLRVGYADECQFKSLRKDPEELFLKH